MDECDLKSKYDVNMLLDEIFYSNIIWNNILMFVDRIFFIIIIIIFFLEILLFVYFVFFFNLLVDFVLEFDICWSNLMKEMMLYFCIDNVIECIFFDFIC